MADDKTFTLGVDLVGNAKQLIGGVQQATAALKGLVSSSKLAAFGVAAGMAVIGIVSYKAARKAVAAFAVFDAAIREIATLLPVTREGIVGLEEALINLSTRVPAPPELLAQATYQAVSAGLTDTADALLVVEQSAKAAAAGLSDAFTAVDAITTVLNAYQLEASEAARVSDVFFKTIEQGKLRFEDIASNIGNVATSAALGNVSLEELGAALATLTKFGINAAEASTSLNRAILSIINPTKAQSDAAAKYGVELSATALKTKGFTEVLRELEEATGGSVEALGEIFPNIRAARSLFVLAGNGADEYRRILREVNNSAGATASAFEEVTGSLQVQRQLLGNQINQLWLQLGQALLPDVLRVVEALNRAFETQNETLLRLAETTGDLARIEELRRKVLAADLAKQIKAQAFRAGGVVGSVFVEGIARAFEQFTGDSLFGEQLNTEIKKLRDLEVQVLNTANRAALPDQSPEQVKAIADELDRLNGKYKDQIDLTQRVANEADALGLIFDDERERIQLWIGDNRDRLSLSRGLVASQDQWIDKVRDSTDAELRLLDVRQRLQTISKYADPSDPVVEDLREEQEYLERIIALEKNRREIEQLIEREGLDASLNSTEAVENFIEALERRKVASLLGSEEVTEAVEGETAAREELAALESDVKGNEQRLAGIKEERDELSDTAQVASRASEDRLAALRAEREAIVASRDAATDASRFRLNLIESEIDALERRSAAHDQTVVLASDIEARNLRAVQEQAFVREQVNEDLLRALDDEEQARASLTQAQREFNQELTSTRDKFLRAEDLERERLAAKELNDERISGIEAELDATQRLYTFTERGTDADEESLQAMRDKATALIEQRDAQVEVGRAAEDAANKQIAALARVIQVGDEQGLAIDTTERLEEQLGLVRQRAEEQRSASRIVQAALKAEKDGLTALLAAEEKREGADPVIAERLRGEIALVQNLADSYTLENEEALAAITEQEAAFERLKIVQGSIAANTSLASASRLVAESIGEVVDESVNGLAQLYDGQKQTAALRDRIGKSVAANERDLNKIIGERSDLYLEQAEDQLALFESAQDAIAALGDSRMSLFATDDTAALEDQLAGLQAIRDEIVAGAAEQRTANDAAIAAKDEEIAAAIELGEKTGKVDQARIDSAIEVRDALEEQSQAQQDAADVAIEDIDRVIDGYHNLAAALKERDVLREWFLDQAEAAGRLQRAMSGAAPTINDIIFAIAGVTATELAGFAKTAAEEFGVLEEALENYREELSGRDFADEEQEAIALERLAAAAALVNSTIADADAKSLINTLPEEDRIAAAEAALAKLAKGEGDVEDKAAAAREIFERYNVTLDQMRETLQVVIGDILRLAGAMADAEDDAVDLSSAFDRVIISLIREGKDLDIVETLAKTNKELAAALENVKQNIGLVNQEIANERILDFLGRIAEGYERITRIINTDLKPPPELDKPLDILPDEARVNGFRKDLEAINRSLGTTEEKSLKIQEAMLKWDLGPDDLSDALNQIIDSFSVVDELTGETSVDVEGIVDGVILAANAAINMARAFGLASGEAAELARNITGIAEGIARIAAGDPIGGAIQAGTSLIALGVSVFGKSAEEKQAEENRIKVLEQNTRVVERLNTELGALGDAIRNLSGRLLDVFGDVASDFNVVVDDVLTNPTEGFGGGFIDQRKLTQGAQAFVDDLKASGITATELDRVLRDLGVSGEHIIRQFEYGDAALEELTDEVTKFSEALRDVALDELFEGFGGREREDALRRQLNDDTAESSELRDAVLALIEFGDLPEDIKKALLAIDWDNLTAADLDFVEGVMREIFEAVAAGDPRALEWFKNIPVGLIEQIIGNIDGIVDGLQEAADAAGPDSTSFQVFRGITELTGNRIAGLLETDTYWNRMTALNSQGIAELLGAGGDIGDIGPINPRESVSPPTLEQLEQLFNAFSAAARPQVTIDSFSINFEIDGQLDDVVALRAGQIAASEFDRALGDNYLVQRRAFGTRPTRTS